MCYITSVLTAKQFCVSYRMKLKCLTATNILLICISRFQSVAPHLTQHNLACRKQSMVVANHKWQPIRSEVWRQCRKPVSLCRSANFESFNGWDGSYVLLLMYNDYITENKSFSHTVVSYDFWRLGIKCTK